jgi:hypothetical protein
MVVVWPRAQPIALPIPIAIDAPRHRCALSIELEVTEGGQPWESLVYEATASGLAFI